MAVNPTSQRCNYSVGEAFGRALADRMIELARPGATIIDNCPTIVLDRRKYGAMGPSSVFPNRRRAEAKSSE
jgi:hypothetical protein